MKKKLLLFGIVAVTAAAVACGEKAATPRPEPGVSSETAAAAADGSTLKATAPAPQQRRTRRRSACSHRASWSRTPRSSTWRRLARRTLQYASSSKRRVCLGLQRPDGCGAGLTTARCRQTSSSRRRPTLAFRAELGSSVGPWSATGPSPHQGGGGAPSIRMRQSCGTTCRCKTIGTLVGGAQLAPQGRLLRRSNRTSPIRCRTRSPRVHRVPDRRAR